MSVTLAQLRTRARQRADMENSTFVSDSELNFYINSSIAELHDLLVSAYGSDYFLSTHSFSTVASTADYALPADFYKLAGIDAQYNGSDWVALRPFNFNERNRNQDLSVGTISGPDFRYRIMGSNIKLAPVPNAVHTIKVWYTPKATELSLDADTLNDLNQFAEYVIVDAAIKCLQKEESDVSVLMAQKAELRRRIEIMAQNRDASEPESVSDVYSANTDYWSAE